MSFISIAIKGFAWTSIATIVRSLVSLLQISILTRFLEKSDFGIVAIASLFIGFTQLFMDLGVSVGIMHRHDILPRQYSSLFFLNIICGVILTVFLCIIAPIISILYNESSLTPILCILSLTVFFASLGCQHRTVQQKKMRFKYISLIDIISCIFTLIVAVFLAYSGYGVYSLVYSTLFYSVSSNLTFLIVGLYKDHNISFHFNLKEIYIFLNIGIYSIGSQMLDYFSREMDVLVMSFIFSKETIGVYSLCKKLVLAAYSAINPILLKVLTPMLSSIHEDVVRVRRIYYEIVETISIVSVPIYFMIAVFSSCIIMSVYGEQYLDSAPILSLLAILYALSSINNPITCLQTAYGRTDLGFYWTIVRILTTVILLFLGSYWGIYGLLIIQIIGFFIVYPSFWKITIKPMIGGKMMDILLLAGMPLLLNLLISIPIFAFFYKRTNILFCVIICFIYIVVLIFSEFILQRNSFLVSSILSYLKNKKACYELNKKSIREN